MKKCDDKLALMKDTHAVAGECPVDDSQIMKFRKIKNSRDGLEQSKFMSVMQNPSESGIIQNGAYNTGRSTAAIYGVRHGLRK